MKVTFDKISNFLYSVLIDGKESLLLVEHNGYEFSCCHRDFLNIRTRTLEEMRTLLEGAL